MKKICFSPPDGSLVVVTGGSKGIGFEIAKKAASEGFSLLLIGRDNDALESAKEVLLQEGSPCVHLLSCDLSDATSSIDLIESELERINKPIAALVNNAGIGMWGEFSMQNRERLTEMIELNCSSLVALTSMLLERIKDSQGGVLNVASTAAFQPGPGMTVYHATKAFVLWFSLALREELHTRGVCVTALCPGPVPTEFNSVAGVGESVDSLFRVRLSSMSAKNVAHYGWRGLKRNKAIVVPGLANKFGCFCVKLLPLPAATRITRIVLGALDKNGSQIR